MNVWLESSFKIVFLNPTEQTIETTTTSTPTLTPETTTLPMSLLDEFFTSSEELPVPEATIDLSNSKQ